MHDWIEYSSLDERGRKTITLDTRLALPMLYRRLRRMRRIYQRLLATIRLDACRIGTSHFLELIGVIPPEESVINVEGDGGNEKSQPIR